MAKRFTKWLQLHQKNRSTEGGKVGALPNCTEVERQAKRRSIMHQKYTVIYHIFCTTTSNLYVTLHLSHKYGQSQAEKKLKQAPQIYYIQIDIPYIIVQLLTFYMPHYTSLHLYLTQYRVNANPSVMPNIIIKKLINKNSCDI